MSSRPRVLFLSHNASRTGASSLLLQLAQWLMANSDLGVEVLLREGGPLEHDFARLGAVSMFRDEPPAAGRAPWRVARALGIGGAALNIQRSRTLRRLAGRGVSLVYSNTITNGAALERLAPLGCPVVTNVHELAPTIRRHGEENLRLVRRHTTRWIAGSAAVRTELVGTFGVDASNVDVVHEFIDARPRAASELASLREARRRELGIPPDAFVVGACGTTDWRKGPDLFVHLARAVLARGAHPDVHFVWLGGATPDEPEGAQLAWDVEHAGLAPRVRFLGRRADAIDWFPAFDAFTLVSREDAFPLVCLHAAAIGLPVLCFAGAGGEPEFVEDDAGFVVPYLDVDTMAARVLDLAASPGLRRRLGERAMHKVRERHDVSVTGPRVLEILRSLM
jgi:glycosyltransferase involved in cell wall biosynthesis